MRAGRSFHFYLKKAVEVLMAAWFILWAILPYFRSPLFILPGFTSFLLLLFTRSFLLYKARLSNGTFSPNFSVYVSRMKVVPQNTILSALASIAPMVVAGFILAADRVGLADLFLCIDAVLVSVIFLAFFRRPGTRRTLSRSIDASDEHSEMIADLALKAGVKPPDFRIIPSFAGRRPNAFSWSIPGKRGYIFAEESLFSVLTDEEAGGILMHELGHLRWRHSEKSFLLSTFIPLLWANTMVLPFAFFSPVESFPAALASAAVGLFYIAFFRGSVSRRFEKAADVFAARNYDRDIYLSSLRKLTEIGEDVEIGRRTKFNTHDSLERREELIRNA